MKRVLMLVGVILIMVALFAFAAGEASARAATNGETFTVTWINYDNSVLRVDEGVEAGTVAEYRGGTPVFPNEVPEGYVYVFSKFGLYVPGQATQDTDFIVTEDTTYKAKFVRYNADNYALFNVHCMAGEEELPDYFRQSAKKIGNVQTAAMNIESIDGYYYVRASEESVLIAKGSTNDLYLYYAPILGTAEIVESETAENTLEVSGIPAEFTDPQYSWYRVDEDGSMTPVGQAPALECNDDTVGRIRCEIKNSEGAIVAEATVCCIDVTVIGEGTVSPEGNAYVLPGANRTFTFSKATEYTIDDDQTATGDSVTFDNIQESHKLTVVFVKQVSHSITTTGNLSEVLKLDSVSDLGNNVTYKWFRVDNGTDIEIGHESLYQLTSADKVAGKVIKCMASGTTAYTIAETTIHKITASAGSNGTVTPNGTVYTINGARPKFTFSADTSYKVDTVTADSQSQTASTSYTFPALDKTKTTLHTLLVTFTKGGASGGSGSRQQYRVTWLNYDNSELYSGDYEEGSIAVYPYGTPVFPGTVPAEYIYVFNKFGLYVPGQLTQDVSDFTVTEDVTYKAKYVRYSSQTYALLNVYHYCGKEELRLYFTQTAKRIGTSLETRMYSIESDEYQYMYSDPETLVIQAGTNDLTLYYQKAMIEPPSASILILPADMTHILDEAFEGDESIESVEIGSKCVRIGSRAFANCANLRDVYIPSSVKVIGDDAFDGCEDIVICTPMGSYAYDWAREHNFSCETI